MTTVIGTPLPGVKIAVPGHGVAPRIHTTTPGPGQRPDRHQPAAPRR